MKAESSQFRLNSTIESHLRVGLVLGLHLLGLLHEGIKRRALALGLGGGAIGGMFLLAHRARLLPRRLLQQVLPQPHLLDLRVHLLQRRRLRAFGMGRTQNFIHGLHRRFAHAFGGASLSLALVKPTVTPTAALAHAQRTRLCEPPAATESASGQHEPQCLCRTARRIVHDGQCAPSGP